LHSAPPRSIFSQQPSSDCNINQPRPEERALARVSKDGQKRNRASGHPSRRRFAPPQDEVCGLSSVPPIRLVSCNRSISPGKDWSALVGELMASYD
jgi:hypothetical protein